MKTEHPTTTTNSSTSIPDWLTAASQGAAGQGAALPQYSPYTGAGYAGMTPAQMQAISAAMGHAGQGQGIATQGVQGLLGGAGYQAPQVTASSLTPQIQGLLNPATQSVIDTTNAQIDKNTATSVNASDNQMAAQHAFGGDRQAIADSNIRNQADMTKASTAAGLNQGNYNTALAAALQSAQGNQGASGAAANTNIQGALGLGSLGQSVSGMNTGDVNSLLNAGGQQQQTATNQNLFNYQQYLNQFQIPDTQAQTYASILGSLPHNTTGNSTQTGTSYSSPLMGLAGLGISAMGIPGVGAGIGGLFGSLGGGGGGSSFGK